jgi:hypothetical protein
MESCLSTETSGRETDPVRPFGDKGSEGFGCISLEWEVWVRRVLLRSFCDMGWGGIGDNGALAPGDLLLSLMEE